MAAHDSQPAGWREIMKLRASRWSLASSVSSLGCILASKYLYGPLGLASVIILGVAFLVSTVMFWRSSPGPYRRHSNITR
jgi:uncharacterized protein (DUF58 family)